MDPSQGAAVDWGPLIVGLLGGLALFLFGMEQLTESLRSVAGAGIRTLLARMTTNRFKAALTGASVTAVIQSSSVTTVLVVGFVSAGLMTLSQSVGVIMGANIGSTVTAQIIAFKISEASLFMIAAGFAVKTFVSHEHWRRYGSLLLGLGLLFLGMHLMSEATSPLRSYPPFIDVMERMDNPFVLMLIGALFTALVQSSAATMGIVIALAGAGLISLPSGIAMAFGANVGTCITAWLAAQGRPAEARQAALIHALFNVIGVLVWLPFIEPLAELVRSVSPAAPELAGAARLAAETPRQIANAHTTFNVANTVVFIGFTGPLARLAQRLIPARIEPAEAIARPRYLDEVFLKTPSLALDRVRLELGHLGQYAARMAREAPPAVIRGTRGELDAIYRMDDDVDALHAAVVRYLGRLSQQELTDDESRRLYDCMAAANYIENIGDTIETNLVSLGLERVAGGVRMSESARTGLRPLYDKVVWSVEQAIRAIAEADVALAADVIEAKREISALADDARAHLSGWQAAEDAQRLMIFRIEIDVIENTKRLYYFARRIAKIVVGQPAGKPGRITTGGQDVRSR
jgi:phosphate:Na+ symporter